MSGRPISSKIILRDKSSSLGNRASSLCEPCGCRVPQLEQPRESTGGVDIVINDEYRGTAFSNRTGFRHGGRDLCGNRKRANGRTFTAGFQGLIQVPFEVGGHLIEAALGLDLGGGQVIGAGDGGASEEVELDLGLGSRRPRREAGTRAVGVKDEQIAGRLGQGTGRLRAIQGADLVSFVVVDVRENEPADLARGRARAGPSSAS